MGWIVAVVLYMMAIPLARTVARVCLPDAPRREIDSVAKVWPGVSIYIGWLVVRSWIKRKRK